MECSLRRRSMFSFLSPHRRNFLRGSSQLIRNCCKHFGILWCTCYHTQCKSRLKLLPEISCAEYLTLSSSLSWWPFFVLMHDDFPSPHPCCSLSWGSPPAEAEARPGDGVTAQHVWGKVQEMRWSLRGGWGSLTLGSMSHCECSDLILADVGNPWSVLCTVIRSERPRSLWPVYWLQLSGWGWKREPA